MDILKRIRQLKENKPNDYADQLYQLCDEMEEMIGEAEMWKTVRLGFSIDELAENLEYIAKEEDL